MISNDYWIPDGNLSIIGVIAIPFEYEFDYSFCGDILSDYSIYVTNFQTFLKPYSGYIIPRGGHIVTSFVKRIVDNQTNNGIRKIIYFKFKE